MSILERFAEAGRIADRQVLCERLALHGEALDQVWELAEAARQVDTFVDPEDIFVALSIANLTGREEERVS